MNLSVNKDVLISKIKTGKIGKYPLEHIIAYYSAAVALADIDILSEVLKLGKKCNIERTVFYEIILQSYLFLGFPRMLIAAENLNKFYPAEQVNYKLNKISEKEASDWFNNGTVLCQQVYKDMYEPLKENVLAVAPDVFRWMIIEGYGKVLSRDTVNIKDRELSIIVFLMMENRSRQLFSHIKGAINVGVENNLLKLIVDEIGDAAGDGYHSALEILKQIGIK